MTTGTQNLFWLDLPHPPAANARASDDRRYRCKALTRTGLAAAGGRIRWLAGMASFFKGSGWESASRVRVALVQTVGRTRPSESPRKPRLRGWIHQAAFFAAVPAGVVLVALAPMAKARLAAAVFAFSLAASYGASAAYHRGDWSSELRPWMKRLDHSMIFVLIAGTYTPFCLLALGRPWSWIVLAVVWVGAAVGIGLKALKIDGFHRTTGALYITLGWVGVLAAPAFVDRLSVAVMILLLVGGLLYTVGAVVLMRERPNPWPAWFGYHELWHAMTVAAGACHFVAVLLVLIVARSAVPRV
jgi:hemolysin III